MTVTVKYQVAIYSGEVCVNAEDDWDNDQIIAKAKRQLIQNVVTSHLDINHGKLKDDSK